MEYEISHINENDKVIYSYVAYLLTTVPFITPTHPPTHVHINSYMHMHEHTHTDKHTQTLSHTYTHNKS